MGFSLARQRMQKQREYPYVSQGRRPTISTGTLACLWNLCLRNRKDRLHDEVMREFEGIIYLLKFCTLGHGGSKFKSKIIFSYSKWFHWILF